MNQTIKIPLSKSKLLVGIGVSIFFAVLGILLFMNAAEFRNDSLSLFRNPLVFKIVGVMVVLFFGLSGMYLFAKMFDKTKVLTIDSNGITDHSTALSVGLIKWKDISGIRTKQVRSNKFLLIDVLNPEEYIKKAENDVIEKSFRSKMKTFGTPLAIISNTLKYDFEKLGELLQAEFEKNKTI